jgi:hypothetical protein
MANNGLDFYKKQAVAKAAYACPVSSFETEDEYISHVIKKADEPMQLAQDFGTLIHARLDSILGDNGSVAEGEMVMLPEGREVPLASIIDPALDVIHELNLEFQSTERILTSRLGYAGTSDVLAMKNGMPIIVDYKTKRPQRASPLFPTLNRKCRLRPIGMRPSPSGLILLWVVATYSLAAQSREGWKPTGTKARS